MRSELIGLVGVMVVASAMATYGCSGTGGGGAGGAAGTSSSGAGGSTAGSSGGGATGGSCSNVTPCGGNVVGTWTVTSSCLKVTGEPGPVVGWRGLPVRAGHGVPPGDRNVDRQRRRDVFGQHDHVGRRAVHVGGLVPGHFVDPRHLRWGGQHHQEPGLLLAHLHIRGGRRVHVLGHRPTDRRAWVGLRGAVDERQLHDRRATWSRSRATWATRSTRTASRETS